MNWDAIGSISEALGSLAVFITLIYLATQVRHARNEVRRSLSQSRGEVVRTLALARVSDARLVALSDQAETLLGSTTRHPFVEALVKEGMSAADATSLINEQIALMSYRLQVFQHIDELSAVDRQAFDNHTRGGYGFTRTGRLFYDTFIRPTQHPDFVRYIEGVLAKSP